MNSVKDEAATASPATKTQLTATVPPNGKTSPTRKPRKFEIPQSAVLNVPEPSPTEPRTWTISTTTGVSVSGYLPPWANSLDPSRQNVAPENLTSRLEDVNHQRWFPGQIVEVDIPEWTSKGRYVGETAILCSQISVDPFHADPAKRVPTASVELIEGQDDWILDLDPEGVRALAAKYIAAGRQLLDEVLPALTEARADWTRNGGGR